MRLAITQTEWGKCTLVFYSSMISEQRQRLVPVGSGDDRDRRPTQASMTLLSVLTFLCAAGSISTE